MRRPYAARSRQSGEISTSEAAELLDCHTDTVRRWVRAREAGEEALLRAVRRDRFGRVWLSRAEIERLRAKARLR